MSGGILSRHDQVAANAAKLPAMHSGAHTQKSGSGTMVTLAMMAVSGSPMIQEV